MDSAARTATAKPAFLRLRGKSFMSVVLTPEAPLENFLADLDAQIARSPKVFDGRPVLLDVSRVLPQAADLPALVQSLTSRGIRVIGIDGSMPHATGPYADRLPPVMAGGRNAQVSDEVRGAGPPQHGLADGVPYPADGAPPPPQAAPAPATEPGGPASPGLVLDSPLRSGQSLTHTAGDVTIVGSVASGSEVIAGGSIHIYGTLRGRAIAGMLGASSGTARPRIFCRRLEAELLAIDGVYKTADEIPPALQGRAVQAWLEGDELKVAALD